MKHGNRVLFISFINFFLVDMGKLLDTRRVSGVAFATAVSFLLVVFVTYGATTISTSINTGGTLTVSGASTLSGALSVSGTNLSTLGGGFISQASSSIASTLTVSGPFSASSSVLVGGAFIFNDSSANDLDVRMEGATEANLFFLDGSTDRIGIATNAPNTTFEVVGTASTTNLVVGGNGSISGIIKGTCTVFSGIVVRPSAPVTHADCFIASGTPGLKSDMKIFISASGTAAETLVITGASTTVADRINIAATTTFSGSASPTLTLFSLEFFGIR